jgi:hypothetical protein
MTDQQPNFRKLFGQESLDALSKCEQFAVHLRKLKKKKVIEERRRKTYQAHGL